MDSHCSAGALVGLGTLIGMVIGLAGGILSEKRHPWELPWKVAEDKRSQS